MCHRSRSQVAWQQQGPAGSDHVTSNLVSCGFVPLQTEIKAIEKRMEETRVVVQHLEMQLLNAACDDPGIIIGAQLILPILQERLDQRGKQWAAERARMAESEIIRMEVRLTCMRACLLRGLSYIMTNPLQRHHTMPASRHVQGSAHRM